MSLSHRFDGPMLAGAYQLGDRGLGRLGAAVPATGDQGPGYMRPWLTYPDDNDDEVWGEIIAFPAIGTLDADETSGFTYSGAPLGTVDSFTFRLKRNGVLVGTYNVALVIGASAIGGVGGGAAGGQGSLSVATGLSGAGGADAGGGAALAGAVAQTLAGIGGADAGGQAQLATAAGLSGTGGGNAGGQAQIGGGTGGALTVDSRYIVSSISRTFRDIYKKPFLYPKAPAELKVLTFDFTHELAAGQELVGAPVVVVTSFEDDQPEQIIAGESQINENKRMVMVPVRGGEDESAYFIQVSCATNDGAKSVSLTGILTVISQA